MIDIKNKHKDENSVDFLLSLCLWIHNNVNYSKEKDIQNLKFTRTSQEIWQSKKSSGCTDFAILFATFARQLGIPTTVLHTAEYEWLQRLKNKGDYKSHLGHVFCECYFNQKWVLVDPTCKRIIEDYNTNKLKLSYQVAGKNIFIPYYRGLDLIKKTIIEHHRMMNKLCYYQEI